MKFVLTRIDENALTVYVTLIVNWFVWLAPVVERDWIGPYVLLALAYLLAIVLPVHALPVKIIAIAVYVTLIVNWFVWLAPVVERDWIGPYVLLALAYLLAIVLPVHALPVKII